MRTPAAGSGTPRTDARTRTRFVIGVSALLSMGSSPLQEMPVPVAIQVELIANVLAFDRNLAERPGDVVVIAVAYQPRYRSSLVAMEDIVEAAAARRLSAAGKALRWVPLRVDDLAAFEDVLRSTRAHVVYFTPIRAVAIAELAAAATRLRIVSTTGVPEYVGQGVAVGFGTRGGRPSILVNLRAARAAGAEFGAQLLELAELTGT